MTKTESGLKYRDTKEGEGEVPAVGQNCVVHYTGWLWENDAKGKQFDSSVERGEPFSFHLGEREVIKGWDEGVSTMKVGGKRELIIPADLAYGERGAGGVIPPNATLMFEVELLELGKKWQKTESGLEIRRRQGRDRRRAQNRPDLRDALHRLALAKRCQGQEVRQLIGPARTVIVSHRYRRSDQGLGRRHRHHESWRQAQVAHPRQAWLRCKWSRRRHSAQCDLVVRGRALAGEIASTGKSSRAAPNISLSPGERAGVRASAVDYPIAEFDCRHRKMAGASAFDVPAPQVRHRRGIPANAFVPAAARVRPGTPVDRNRIIGIDTPST